MIPDDRHLSQTWRRRDIEPIGTWPDRRARATLSFGGDEALSAPTIPVHAGHPRQGVPRAVRYPFEMLAHPMRTTDRLLAEPVWPAFLLVAGFAAVMAVAFLIGYLARVYPPPPDVLATWIEAYGGFYVLPFVDIPPEEYRLALAIAYVPLVLCIWIVMAGCARLLTLLFRGTATFDQYLVLLAFAFFPFWILASVVDFVHSGLLDPVVLQSLRGQHGDVARQVAASFMPLAYTVLFSLGGLWCAAAAARSNGFGLLKAGVIGVSSFVWPTLAGALVVR